MNKKYKNFGVIILIIAAIFLYYSQANILVHKTGPEARLLESRGLVEFDPSNDVLAPNISIEDKARYKEVLDSMKIAGDLKDTKNVKMALDVTSELLNKYPEYADLYVMRTIYNIVLGRNDFRAMETDLSKAIKYRQSKKYISSYDSDTPMYLLMGKVAELKGDYKAEVSNYMAAVDVDPSNALRTDFFGTGATTPGTNSNPTAPSLSDFDFLVQTYPSDHAVYLLRGLYYASFAVFKEQYYAPAIDDLNKAISLSPQSSEANYLLGKLYLNTTFWTTAASTDISDITGGSGGYRDKQREKALIYLNQAVVVDEANKYALAQIAEANYELKNYAEAISAYTKEIELDPNDAGAYNDKALAEINIDQFTKAIKDLNKAVQIKNDCKKQTSLTPCSSFSLYQSLADAYVKVGDFPKATTNYSKAIGNLFAGQLFIMSIEQIRAIYPEFADISDQDLLEGLRQKYYPNMTSVDFNSTMVKNKQDNDFVLSGIYAARGDAYVKSGDKIKAKTEYSRAMNNDTNYLLNPDQQAVYTGF